ncbi:MAG: Dabb family protein [Hydrococcus sp. RM1_1_31]|nr:Dabb family protein [Hydrococcus sp. RM1_1_31]
MSQIQHIALIKFKPEVTSSKIEEILNSLAQLQHLIPGITYFASGAYSSNEGLNQGYTHGFLMTFESAEARDVYLPHREHERVKAEIFPCIDNLIVFDFEASTAPLS